MEIKTGKFDLNVKTESFEGQKTIEVQVDENLCKELCLILILLRDRFVELIELKFYNFSIFLKLNKENDSPYTVIDLKKGIFKGTISLNSLGAIVAFLLRYYKDGIAEAEHIDIDFNNGSSDEVTLVIKTKQYKEYSAEELIKLLGD